MSRSRPQENTPNPCTRWFEWGGADGTIKYYDKEKKENVVVGEKFTFIVLDQLSTVKGWHDPSQSGITSNEVRDTRVEPMSVRSFKGGAIAEGLYKEIRDRVNSAGGKFTTNIYIAYKDGADLKLGSLQFSGAALSAWMEFHKCCRADILKQAVTINGSDEGKKGSVTFKTPKFSLTNIAEDTNEQATAIDIELQKYLDAYFKRTRIAPGSDLLPGEEEANSEAGQRPLAEEFGEVESDDPW